MTGLSLYEACGTNGRIKNSHKFQSGNLKDLYSVPDGKIILKWLFNN
jgi:hypothetical protein